MFAFRPALTVAFLLSTTVSHSAFAVNYSVQNGLIGATDAVQSSANYGAGVIVGDIDTGIVPWAGFDPAYNGLGVSNIDNTNSANCVGGTCKLVYPTDGNGHGTFTASEIVGGVKSIGMVGVAPKATLLAVEVLNAQGSGTSTDVVNGIRYAADHGAQVLNLSLGPSGSASQQAAFYQSIASAVNYATSKGVILVFAGGNAKQNLANGANITGFTDTSLTHIFFMGSTNASEKLSSFSNKPGNGYFLSTTGKKYYYKDMWMMADGENIWGASTYKTSTSGYTYITQMSGTSMAAPQGTGAVALLLSRWPYLYAQGTVPKILETTAQDMGTKGIDTTYGDGFLRVDLAMKPVGSLTVPTGSGKNVNVSGSQAFSGGALGNMSRVSNVLSKASAFDDFGRDFPLSLGGAIAAKGKGSTSSPATVSVSGQTGAASRLVSNLTEGNWAAFSGGMTTGEPTIGPKSAASFTQDPARGSSGEWSVAFSQNGTYVGVGQGSNAGLSFNDARWGKQSAFFNTDSSASAALLGLTSGVNFASGGTQISKNARVSMTVISGEDSTLPTQQAGLTPSAQGVAFGYTFSPSESVQVSLTSSFLNEHNMLLGSLGEGALGFGSSNSSMSVGMGSNVDLGEGFQIGFDASVTQSGPTHNADSLISDTSRLEGAAFSLALAKNELTDAHDSLSLSVNKPLRLYSGTADVNVPVGADQLTGAPIIQTERVKLAPTGNETDLGFAYNRPLWDKDTTLGFSLTYRDDADNVAGAHDAAAMLRYKMAF